MHVYKIENSHLGSCKDSDVLSVLQKGRANMGPTIYISNAKIA